jgi:chaperonin cofactor prefoldin
MAQGTTTPITGDENIAFGGESGKLDFVTSQKSLSEYSNRVLQALTQTRERVFEIQRTITDALPGITRLGGKIQDVSKTISEVALASRRNVIASEKDIQGLFTVTKVIGGTVEELANAFLDVGRGIEKIPEELGESIEYIQNIGGNARTIMTDVTKNMGIMNRYQFNEGVLGLTKMAAQASMLRFDMSKTFSFAEDLYKPERAIEVAAAFQRMGVAIGGLGDPLQLMNQSINDPSGLQNSLVEVSKQFTYLDKQTNTFKISRQGVLVLKELGQQAGVDANEMMKMGLAASELDRRLSAIGSAGLNIKEEDKQYLANIAKMEDGSYKVTMDDGTKRELSQLNQKEFEELINQQKNAPKGLEETARAALRLDQIVANDIKAIKNAVVGEILTVPTLQDAQAGLRKFSEFLGDKITSIVKPGDLREPIDNILKDFSKDILTSLSEGETDPSEILNKMLEGKGDQFTDLANKKVTEFLGSFKEDFGKLKEVIGDFGNKQAPISSLMKTITTKPSSNELITTTGLSVGGTRGSGSNPVFNQSTQPRNTNVNVGGEVNVNVKIPTLPMNFTPAEIAQAKQMIQEAFDTPFFANHIKNIMSDKSPVNTQ